MFDVVISILLFVVSVVVAQRAVAYKTAAEVRYVVKRRRRNGKSM